MHIPASMLQGSVCPVTLAVSAAGVGVAGVMAKKSQEKPSGFRFAAVTALIFALQMLNFPVQHGTSGHLVGGLLAVSLLGVPFAVLSMAIVLLVQAVFFGDGGINALGANILNMSLIGAGLLGVVYLKLQEKGLNRNIALASAAFVSVLAAATACSFEVALAGSVALDKVLPAMLGVHVLIGLGEALLTVAVVTALNTYGRLRQHEPSVFSGALVLAVFAALLSPLASGFPDGLEWVAEKLSFIQYHAFEMPALFPDYQAVFIGHEGLSTIFAGIAGVALVYGFAFFVTKLLAATRPARA